MDKLYIGTSGFSFKDWVGPFYPQSMSSQKMLQFYAKEFDSVELNYTYYRIPSAKSSENMVRNTPDNFCFWVKAFQDFTHKRDLGLAGEYKEGIKPFQESGKLAGLLFQFPQSFHNTEANRAFLGEVAEEFDVSLAVEFRDNSWANPAIYDFLKKRSLSLIAVDEPQTSTLFPRIAEVTGDTGYIRFHSRDAGKWYKDGSSRYDYLYSDEELSEWLPRIEAMAKRVRRMFVYFNNCQRGQAVANARRMKELVGQLKLV